MLKARMARGITFLKQDFGIDLMRNVPGDLSDARWAPTSGVASGFMHPFTGIHNHRQGDRLALGLGRDRFGRRSAWRFRLPPTTTVTSA